MRILGIIPARGGSKGVPGKNIKILKGKPLLQYTSDVALHCKGLDKVMLSSDDTEIMKIAEKLGIEVPFKRPSEFANDNSPTLPVIKHALEYYKSIGEEYDAICLLQTTSPFRTIEFLNNAIIKFKENNSDSLVSVLEVPHEFNPHWTFEINKEDKLKIATGEDKIISRRQELPKAFHRDGAIYLTKVETILNDNSLFGKEIAYIKSEKERYVNIDTLKDWKKAESLIDKLY